MRGAAVVAVAVASLLAPAVARAGDFEEEPFSLRFPSALSRFSRYPDVAGVGGASAAAVWGSSPNPAATAWLSLDGLSAQRSRVSFDAGTRVDVSSLSCSFPVGGLGTFQPSLAQARSNRAETRDGREFGFDAVFGEIQWGRKVREDTAIGLNLSATGSEVEFGLGGRTASRSRSGAWAARAGILQGVGERVRLGASVEYSSSSDRSILFDLSGPGPDRRQKDTTRQLVLQPGVAWEYGESRRVYFDVRATTLRNREGGLRVRRFLAGIDHEFVPFLNGRAGLALDDRGNASPTLGIGVFPSKRVFIDISWQRDLFPEVRREFGRSHTFGIAVSIAF